MNWIKSGHLFRPSGTNEFLLTHAANPVPMKLREDLFRVFYNGRDAHNRSSVGFVDIDIVTGKIYRESHEPILRYGDEGSFYSHGISLGNLYSYNSRRYILFMGWHLPENQHWRGSIGQIEIIDNDSMKVISINPYMGLDDADTISLSYPWVEVNLDGSCDMWYGSTISWASKNGEMIHVIKHASSYDGREWSKSGLAIPYKLGIAQAFSRPTIYINESGKHMWFSYRSGKGEQYRIGYARYHEKSHAWSLDLEHAGIDLGEDGEWDSEMVCYPYVFRHNKATYMLYNGNGYGKTGIGLAKLESDL